MTDTGETRGDRLDADAYDLLRERLAAAARELAGRAEALNSARQEAFGGGELHLAGTERLGTRRASLPADVAPVGAGLLFGANPAQVEDVADVLSLREADEPVAGLLDDPQFVRDFRELYRYYRQTRLLRLRALEGRLLAVFRTGPSPADVKALGWRIGPDGGYAYQGTARDTAEADGGAYAVTWTPAGREAHVPGRHPHLAFGGVTVDPTGGTLTVTVGDTVHEEPVEDALQSLADADVEHAWVEPLLLLRVRPYHEDTDRYFAVNTRTEQVERLDAIGQACLRLPDEQGVVFPGGYALATGGTRTFDLETGGVRLDFERLVRSANGEDVLYVFHAEGRRLLLPYNLIRKEVAAPLTVQGAALYDDGTLLTLRPADGDEPARVHTLQRWRTPFVSDTWAAAQPAGEGPLARIGNADLVRAVSDALSVARAALETAPGAAVYQALAASCDRVLDRHHWLADDGCFGLDAPLTAVRDTAADVLAEYARVREATARAGQAVDEAAAQVTTLVRRVRGEAAAGAEEWVTRLTALRQAQGRLVTLRETRYADLGRLDALSASLAAESASAASRAAACFADEHAFDGFRARAAELAASAADLDTAADGDAVGADLDELAQGLATVTETAATLEITDATVRTRILAAAADVLGAVNQARAVLDARRRELLGAESAAEFAAESALLAQSVSGALAAADTPEACDLHLGRLLVQVENLTTRFATDPERLAALAERRDEIQQTLAARKQSLADERAQRAGRLAESAERILDGVRRRAAALASPDDVNTYFASDPMPAQHRRIAAELRESGDPARAAELTAALAAARQDAARTLRDRADLYEDDGATIRLGRHRFPVNAHPFDLALVPHGDTLAFTVTGTDYLAPVGDPAFAATRRFWTRPLVSETPDLYRSEYLAATLLLDALPLPGATSGTELRPGGAAGAPPSAGLRPVGGAGSVGAGVDAAGGAGLRPGGGAVGGAGASGTELRPGGAAGAPPSAGLRPVGGAGSVGAGVDAAGGAGLRAGGGAGTPGGGGRSGGGGWLADAEGLVREAVQARVDEGYQRGVHDHDAAVLLDALAAVAPGAGLLRYPPGVRAAAQLFWVHGTDAGGRAAWTTRARSLTRAAAFGGAATAGALEALGAELGGAAAAFLRAAGVETGADSDLVGEYLVAELAAEQAGFVAGEAAADVGRRFADALGGTDGVPYKEVVADLDALGGDLAARWQLALGWLGSFAGENGAHGDHLETAAALVCGADAVRYAAGGGVDVTVEGLLGAHPRIVQGRLDLRLDELLTAVRRFRSEEVPAYRAYQRHRTAVVAAERDRLGLAAYRPRPLTGFVRNRLLDEVYLPLVGDSLAKQFGTAGGLLMLLSPPGYGKTTLVEYVAARLGLALVTVSGPALGTGTTSLDPDMAPDATARREVEKLDFALALGSNVLLHLDDIQHTSPELLQKFIPLCDAQRRIEGAGGTHELRGKRFAVCMSGNPYTESGGRFRVPDMLANRADVWNLGDVLTGREDVFALSYVENALTANPVLAPLAGRERSDLELLLRLAAADPTAGADGLTYPYEADELASVLAVLRQALQVRRVILAVNSAYIAAATGGGEPFLLQGSYRDMTRLVSRLHPTLTSADVDALITDHYRAESHVLASGATSALHHLAALRAALA
ncbi:DNA repair ATPase [Actinacidiphila bryophytorum]|nr:DNA repair ATPase [Actinacidiphila bryophytorum]MBM9439924.1 DNA repair ATPase [Actinacidiphila bryophytorum]